MFISNEDCLAALEEAERKYFELRAAAGMPFAKPDPAAPLPAWVMTKGQRAKINWVMPSSKKPDPAPSYATKPATPTVAVAQPVAKPAATEETGTSFASRVRAVIRDAKAQNQSPDWVVAYAVENFGMKLGSAKNCVKFNWDRV